MLKTYKYLGKKKLLWVTKDSLRPGKLYAVLAGAVI